MKWCPALTSVEKGMPSDIVQLRHGKDLLMPDCDSGIASNIAFTVLRPAEFTRVPS
ncbi:hypothetical protein O9929_01790 [Vibrio lentus]|nr:hypothetical protein [Vibrio lentus]